MGFFGVPSVCKRKSIGNLFLFLDGAKTKMPTLRGAPKRHQNPQDGDESKTGGDLYEFTLGHSDEVASNYSFM